VPDTVSEEGKNWFGKEVEQLSENIKSSFPPTLPQKHGKYRWEQAGSKHPSNRIIHQPNEHEPKPIRRIHATQLDAYLSKEKM